MLAVVHSTDLLMVKLSTDDRDPAIPELAPLRVIGCVALAMLAGACSVVDVTDQTVSWRDYLALALVLFALFARRRVRAQARQRLRRA